MAFFNVTLTSTGVSVLNVSRDELRSQKIKIVPMQTYRWRVIPTLHRNVDPQLQYPVWSDWQNITVTCGCTAMVPGAARSTAGNWWDPPAPTAFGGEPHGFEVMQIFDTVWGRVRHGSICQEQYIVTRRDVQFGDPWFIKARISDCNKLSEYRTIESLVYGPDTPDLNGVYRYGVKSSDGQEYISGTTSFELRITWSSRLRLKAVTKSQTPVYNTTFTIRYRGGVVVNPWQIVNVKEETNGDGYIELILNSTLLNGNPDQPFNIIASKTSSNGITSKYEQDGVDITNDGINVTLRHLGTMDINFYDTTAVSVTGTVLYHSWSGYLNESDLCGSVYSEICAYPLDIGGSEGDLLGCTMVTESSGAFTLTIPVGVSVRLKPRYRNFTALDDGDANIHTFSPESIVVSATFRNVKNIKFLDTTTVNLNVSALGGACNRYIGASTFRIWTQSCGSVKTITVDGTRSIAVSPVNWSIQLRQFLLISDTTFGAASNFFRNNEEQSANMSTLVSQKLEYIYHPMPTVEVKFPGKNEINCTQNGGFSVSLPNTRGRTYNVTIKVWEDFIDNSGNLLATCRNVSTSLFVRDQVSSGPCNVNACNFTTPIDSGFMIFAVIPGEALTTAPYTRLFMVRAARVDAPSPIFTRVDTNVLITGDRKVGNNSIQNLPKASVPLLTLRRPWGDNSYAELDKATSWSTTITQLSGDIRMFESHVQAEFGYSVGGNLFCKGFLAFECEPLPEQSGAYSDGIDYSNMWGSESEKSITLEYSISETFSTPRMPYSDISKPDYHDAILLPTLAIQYSKTETLSLNEDTCAIDIQTSYKWIPVIETSKTQAWYTIGMIEGEVLPELQKQLVAAKAGNLNFGTSNYTSALLEADIKEYQNLLSSHRNKSASYGLPAGNNFLLSALFRDTIGSKKMSKSVSFGQFKHFYDLDTGEAGRIIGATKASNESLNNSMKGDFEQDEIITFGAPYLKEYSISGSSSQIITFPSIVDDTPYGGINFNFDTFITIGIETEFRGTIESISSKGIEVGDQTDVTVRYVLEDDDENDYFAMLVRRDPDYGTPIFTILGGISQCPWENGTIPASTIEINVDEPDRTDFAISPDQRHVFVFVVNSPSAPEGSGTWIMSPQQSTVNGAEIHINGNPFSAPLPFDISSGDTLEFYVSIGIGDSATSTIDGITFAFARDCDSGAVIHEVSLSVAWLDDCAKVEWVGDISSLSDAQVPWIVNVSSTPLKVQFYNPEFATQPWSTNSRLLRTLLQYRDVTSDTWKTQGDYKNSEDYYGFITVNWNMISGNKMIDDGVYQLRVITQCRASSVATLDYYETTWVTGFKDTKVPIAFGLTEPADGIYSVGDEISISYNEPILCPFERSLMPQVQAISVDPVSNVTDTETMTIVCEDRNLKLAFGPTTDFRELMGRSVEVSIVNVRDLALNLGVDYEFSFEVANEQDIDSAIVELQNLKFDLIADDTASSSEELSNYVLENMRGIFSSDGTQLQLTSISIATFTSNGGTFRNVTFSLKIYPKSTNANARRFNREAPIDQVFRLAKRSEDFILGKRDTSDSEIFRHGAVLSEDTRLSLTIIGTHHPNPSHYSEDEEITSLGSEKDQNYVQIEQRLSAALISMELSMAQAVIETSRQQLQLMLILFMATATIIGVTTWVIVAKGKKLRV